MTDREKLIQAHELCQKHYENTGESVILENSTSFGCKAYFPTLWVNSESFKNFSLDELITKLKELLEPKTKYDVNTVVWRIKDDSPCEFMIHDVDNDISNGMMYMDSFDDWWLEEQLYPSRESLIEAQIEYWKSLKEFY